MSFPGFERAQAEFERRRQMSPEDEADEVESRRLRREYQEEHADDLRDRQKDREQLRNEAYGDGEVSE